MKLWDPSSTAQVCITEWVSPVGGALPNFAMNPCAVPRPWLKHHEREKKIPKCKRKSQCWKGAAVPSKGSGA